MQLSSAIERFGTHLEANGNSPHTISSYLRDLGMLADHAGRETAVEGVTSDALAAFLTSDAVARRPDGTPKAPGSVDKAKTSVKAFFRWAHEGGIVAANPAAAIRLKHRRRPAPDVLTVQEKKRLLKLIDQTKGAKTARDAVLTVLVLNTIVRSI